MAAKVEGSAKGSYSISKKSAGRSVTSEIRLRSLSFVSWNLTVIGEEPCPTGVEDICLIDVLGVGGIMGEIELGLTNSPIATVDREK